MRRPITRCPIAAICWLALAVPAFAQLSSSPRPETPRDAVQALIPGSTPTQVDAVGAAVVTQIASVPLGSSSGGFTYVRNEQTGELRPKTTSFGPSFAERPTTLGKPGAFTFGTSYQ